jgi:hypothetical protein
MQAWKGWEVAMLTTRAFTWAEWCAGQQRTLRTLQNEERGHYRVRFTDKELARLAFVRWRYQAGHLGPRGQDNS